MTAKTKPSAGLVRHPAFPDTDPVAVPDVAAWSAAGWVPVDPQTPADDQAGSTTTKEA